MPSNYNGRGPKKQDGKIADKFRDVCPPHKVKDLDALVRQCKGDETKVQAKIAEWWEQPQIEEPQWESVGKVNKKPEPKKDTRGGGFRGSSDRDRSSRDDRDRGGMSGGGRRGERSYGGGGRDGPRRDGRGGRGGGDRYGDRDRNRGGDRGAQPKPTPAPAAPAPKPKESGAPAPVSAVPAPKGVWGGQSFAAAAAAASAPKQAAPAAPAATEPQAPVPEHAQQEEPPLQLEPEDEVQIDLGGSAAHIISSEDPTPSGLSAPLAPPAVSSGNVWGSKGGAHLIQTIKTPIPAPVPVVPEIVDELEPDPIEPEEEHVVEEPPMPEPEPVADPEQPLVKESTFGVGLDSVLPPSVNGANINASGWEPVLDEPSQQPSVDISQPSPVVPISVGTAPSMPEPEPVSLPQPVESTPPVVAPLAPAAEVKPSSVLNMGHWEQDGDDDALDFGFGSFAPENDNEPASAPVALATEPLSTAGLPSGAPHASPARPPPGLSMPPMPANAMLVHELEGKLENTTLGSNSVSEKTAATAQSSASSSQPQSFNAVNDLTGQMNPPGMSQYGAMGMYGVAPPGVGLGSMPPGQFPLGGNTQQQQPTSQQADSRPGSGPNLNQASQQQPVPYGMQQTTSSATTNNSANDSSTPSAAPNNNAGMPPGMPSMYQQPNPAYLYAPGQFNQMGHPAYGMQAAAYGAYGAGGQFGHPPQGPGGPQFGYGAHQGGGSGYGAPSHYDERGTGGRGGGNMRDSHGGRGGRGGYRGNRNHHQQNQYGNQGGYGGNPGGYGGYGAMYGGGYGNPGPSGMDHYGGMQQQQQQQQQQGGYGGGFAHQDNSNKKSSAPHGGQQGGFQQQSHLTHQQPLGLQGTSTDTASGAGGWPGSRQQNWGGNWQQES